MFTIVYPPISDIKDEIARRRIVTIKFEDVGANRELTQSFQFGINTDLAVIKKTVNEYLNELNFTPVAIDDLDPDAEVTPPAPTQAELDKTAWDLDVAKLKKAQDLIDCGIVFSASQLTSLATLRTKIATNFKGEYLG